MKKENIMKKENGWQLRLKKQSQSWNLLSAMVNQKENVVMDRIGIENVAPNLLEIIDKGDYTDFTSKWIRYQPDAVVLNTRLHQSYYIEVKASDNIEKDAYRAYSKLAEIGCNVFLLILNNEGEKYVVSIENVKLEPGKETVSRYDEPMPVDADGWIAPRLWDQSKYLKWKEKYPRMSGTPFRRFDFGAMKEYKREK